MNESLQNVSRNVRLVSLCTFASRILGLLRDQAMGAIFGAGPILDTFTVAFRLPNLARVLLGEGALTTAFLPVFMAELQQRGRESAARVTWAVFFSLTGVLCTLILIAEGLILVIRQSFELGPESRLLCDLTACLLPYVLMICLAAQVGAVLNALGRFLWPALVPSILNLVWLIAMWQVVPLWSDEISRIYATAACVVIGGAMQLLFPLPILFASGFGYRHDWRQAMHSVHKIALTMLPVILGLSITQLNAVLDSFVAWGFTRPATNDASNWLSDVSRYPLHEGTATALYLGQRLYQFPLGVFGVALGTVLFPLLTLHAQRGEFDKLRADLSLGIRLVLAIGLPASVGLILIAQPLATAFFEYGRFDTEATRQTGTMIAAYGSGVWAYCGLLILQRGFYAVGDRLTPMYLGLAAMIGNVILDLTLIWPLGGQGLAFSTAVIAAVQCGVTVEQLQRKIGRMYWREIGRTTVKTLFATAIMAACCLLMFMILENSGIRSGRFVRLGLPLLVGAVGFLITARLIGLEEPWQLLAGRRRKTEEQPTSDPGDLSV